MTSWTDYQDDISDAISDSMDVDWSASVGARAVVAWLNENKPLIADTPRVTVPVEPTEAMMKAADAVDWNNEDERASVINMWQAMLSAAPAPEGGAVKKALIEAYYSGWEDGNCREDYSADKARSEADRILALSTREEAPAETREDELKAIARIIFPENERVKMDRDWGGNRSPSRDHWNKAIGQAREILALRAQPPAREDAQPVWVDGVPTKHHAKEWFIAETTFGERVVLTALPEEYTYDFKTADETYIKADRIKRWMPFPDSQYLFPNPAPDALRVAVEALEPFNRAYQAYLAAYANFMPSGATEAEQRFVEGERKDTAEEAAFEVLSKITLEQLCAVNEALAALQAEQGAK